MGFATILGLVGTGISAIGAISSGNAQAAQANYEAQVARNNQITATENANYATAAGETKSYNEGLQQRAKAGEIAAGIAAGGIDVDTGSAAQERESQEALGLTDVQQVRQQAALTAYGYNTQATSFGAQAQLETAQAGFDEQAGFLGGVGSLLSGGAKFGGGVGNLFGGDTTTTSTVLPADEFV